MVLRGAVDDEPKLAALARLHEEFVASRPAWANRIDVGYIATHDLRTLGIPTRGDAAVVGANEPLHLKPLDSDWVINWHEATTTGRVLFGETPSAVGRRIPASEFEQAVREQLAKWRTEIQSSWIAHSQKYQGYIVLTVCRALYALEHGSQATKEAAAQWAEASYPEWSDFIADALRWQRADISEPYNTTVRFVNAVTAS